MLKIARPVSFLLLSVALCSSGVIFAANETTTPKVGISQQQASLKGVVEDEFGPVAGASVVVKGTTNGTVTDMNGNFVLEVKKGDVIVISFIGYLTQEIKYNGEQTIKVSLKEDTQKLDEVVVIGYGTQKKVNLTGAVASVGSEELKERVNTDVLASVQGQVPGVTIINRQGSISINMRGRGNLGTSSPLFVIDGAIADATFFSNLDPNSIESVSFLKDAASSAIYGSRAAYGVVLVKTKDGKEGDVKVTYDGTVSMKIATYTPKVLSSEWYARLSNEAAFNENPNAEMPYSDEEIEMFRNGSNPDMYPNTNWYDLVLDDLAVMTKHSVSVSGGNKVKYFTSLGYMYDDSNLKWGNNNNQRFNLRLTNKLKVFDNFSIESVIAYNRQDQVTPSRIEQALTGSYPQPGLPSSTMDGKPYHWGGNYTPNWYAELGGDNNLKVSGINISENLKYKLTSYLDAVVNLGYNTSTATRDAVKNSITWYTYDGTLSTAKPNAIYNPNQASTEYSKSFARTDYYSVSGYLNFHQTFAEKHTVSAMLGAQYNLKEYDYTVVTAKDVQSSLEILNGSGDIFLKNSAKTSSPDKWQEAMMSYFGRFNYNYLSKYLLEANLRYDGSSKFLPENRWDFFYGFSGGWRLTEENFMKNVKFLNELKLRLSYGVVGNQSGISRYDGRQLYNFNSVNGAYLGDGRVSYVKSNGEIATTGRSWERIHNYNLGVDFQLFNSRLQGTVELFMKKNNNMLIAVTYPGILGDKAPASNSGKFEAKGYEGTLTWSDKIGKVNYHIGGTFTYADNKLVDYGGVTVFKSGFIDKQQGYSLNSVFGLKYCGKIQTEEQLRKYKYQYYNGNGIGIPSDIRLGDNMYEDVNGDGVLDEKDYVYLGSDDPKISYSFNLGLEWNNFDFSAVFQGVAKRTIFRDSSNDNYRIPMKAAHLNSTTQSVGDVWSPENRGGRYPTYTNINSINDYNYQCSSWSVENGNYLRLKSVTLGYNFPTSLLNKIRVISRMRVYVSGNDLWEVSKINDGWDPEASRKVSGNGRFPFNRTCTVGLDLTF